MILLVKLATLILIVFCISVSSVSALPPQPLTFQTEFQNIMSVLDHQGTYPDPDTSGWVHNTTGCIWNDADQRFRRGDGNLAANVTKTDSMCLVADGVSNTFFPHVVQVNIYAPSNSLTVLLSNSDGDVWQAGPSVKSGNQRLWKICVVDPVATRYSVWPEVPDTNGGVGLITNYTLQIDNSAKTTRNIVAFWQMAGNSFAPKVNMGC